MLDHLRRIQRLVLTKVLSGCPVAVCEAREKGQMTHVLVAFAVAIELVEDIRNLPGHLIGPGCLADKKSR